MLHFFFFFSVSLFPAKGLLTVLLVFFCFLVPHVLGKMGVSLFPQRSDKYSYEFSYKQNESASCTTLCLLHSWVAPDQLLRRAGTWGVFAREKHFLFQEEDPEVTKQVDEGGGPRTWSLW